MKLLLTVKGIDQLDNGLPAKLELNERGAIIGRSPTVTWCLPDPTNHVSSRHCEITFRNQQYSITDTSTNGTFVNGRQLSGTQALASRDLIVIGQYQIQADIEGAPAETDAAASAGSGGWTGWDQMVPPPAAPEAPASPFSDNWGRAPAAAAPTDSAWGPVAVSPPEPSSEGWGPSPAVSGASPWGQPVSAAPAQPASPWSSAITETAQTKSGDDIWGQISEGYVVDWARGGFGQAAEAPAMSGWNAPVTAPPPPPPVESAPLWAPSAAISLAPQATQLVPGVPTPEPMLQAAAPAFAPPVPPPSETPPSETPPAVPAADIHFQAFIEALGLNPADLKGSPDEALASAALMLRRLIAGMVVMLEARARAKSQMGAQGTSLQLDGNNPLKFARTPEQALTQLLNPKERGFMAPERAIEDAFVDLQSHQMATLKAMQGALKATLERFSPNEIRKRVDSKGLMAKLFPDARDASLWKAYEKEFSGVVQGSDEAFMDVFSKEFRRAYEDLTARR